MEVLQTLIFVEKEITTRDGRWFVARIMPYRTTENMIDGVVITFVEITASRRVEAELREEVRGLQQKLTEMENVARADNIKETNP